MVVSRKISQVEVFAGSPWEVASVNPSKGCIYRSGDEGQRNRLHTAFCPL